MTQLDDGIYDVLVIDAVAHDNNAIAIDLVVVSGDAKGHVVSLRATGLRRDAIDLIGLPATLTIERGAPRVRFDQ